jgi:ABC-type branched-subunit amino acid transport system substrate-binding protein
VRIRFAALATSLAVVVACGSSGGTKNTTTTTAAVNTSPPLAAEALDTSPGPGPEVTVTPGSRDTQGVSPTQISVGGLAAITGPLGNQYVGIFDGVQAYFDSINAQGGINGRMLKLDEKLDDTTNPSRSVSQAQALNEQYGAFAVVGVASPFFAGGKYLGQNNVPTFGWNVNPEWEGPPVLWGEKGSNLDFTGAAPGTPYLAKKVGATNAGTVAYGVPQSQDCSTGFTNSFKKWGIKSSYQDTSLPFGVTDITADIDKLRQHNVDMVFTCLDENGNELVGRTLQAQQYPIKQYWPNGYDAETLKKFSDVMEGVYFSSFFTPFEAASTSVGLRQFLAAMAKYEPGKPIAEVSLAGWVNADLFVQGLRMIGPDVTRAKLTNAINSIRNFTANGVFPAKDPIDWYYRHHVLPRQPSPDCTAYLQVQHGKFVPILGTPTDPFVCIDHNAPVLPN